MTDSAAVTPVEPIDYRTGAAAATRPPGVVRVLATISLSVAVATFALGAWSATRAYYTAPPRPMPALNSIVSAPYAPTYRSPPPRVGYADGEAIVDGVSRAMKFDDARRKRLREVLRAAQGQVAIETMPDPTPDKMAAIVTESGKLFGDGEGVYAVFGRVRIEAEGGRLRVAGTPGDWPAIEVDGSRTTFGCDARSPFSTWYFRPPDPPTPAPAAPPPPQPPPRGPLELEIRRLAPQVLATTDAAVSALLAILLLLASVGLWGYSRRGRRLHLWWSWIKLPLALAAAAGYFCIVLGGAVRLSGGVAPITQFVLRNPELVTSLLVALYAVTTIVILMLPPVRRYFVGHSPARSE